MWLGLRVLQTRGLNEDDERSISGSMSMLENLFTPEQWELHWNRRFGSYLVGVDMMGQRDDNPTVCANVDAAVAVMLTRTHQFQELPGVSAPDIDAVQYELRTFDPADAIYGCDWVVPFRDSEIRFWIYPDITLHNDYLTDENVWYNGGTDVVRD